jgi:hypothetical protein
MRITALLPAGLTPIVYVLSADATALMPRGGDRVSIEGVILQMPHGVKDRLITPAGANDEIYVEG